MRGFTDDGEDSLTHVEHSRLRLDGEGAESGLLVRRCNLSGDRNVAGPRGRADKGVGDLLELGC